MSRMLKVPNNDHKPVVLSPADLYLGVRVAQTCHSAAKKLEHELVDHTLPPHFLSTPPLALLLTPPAHQRCPIGVSRADNTTSVRCARCHINRFVGAGINNSTTTITMASDSSTAVALTAIRCASYALMAWSLFYLAMFIGKW